MSWKTEELWYDSWWGQRDFYLHQNAKACSGAHPAYYSMDSGE